MAISRLVVRWVLLTALLIVANSAVAQTVYYVRSGATGANNGADWNNAYTALPSSLQRGATYYVAAGSYAGRTFSDAESGTTRITIRKATEADHGTSTGWQSTYGTGQAVFANQFYFTRGYYTIDGQTRTSWTNGYGFRLDNQSSPRNIEADVLIGDGAAVARGVTIRYVDVAGSFSDNDAQNDRNVGVMKGSHNALVEYCYLRQAGECNLFIQGATNVMVQYCYIWWNDSSPSYHAEGVAAKEGANQMTLRYNIWKDIEGTAFIAGPSAIHHTCADWWIYGNVFTYSPNNATSAKPRGGFGDGLVSVFDCDINGDFFFYNNTIVNINATTIGANWGSAYIMVGLGWPTTLQRLYIRNNLWVNCTQGGFGKDQGSISDLSVQNNAYFNTPRIGDTVNVQTGTASPLVNPNGDDYRLAQATAAGMSLNAPYTQDADGNMRGVDGTWDRGAFEFGGGPSTNPPVNSAVKTSSVTDRSANVTWTSDKLSSSIVQYGLTTAYGTVASNSAMVTSHSLTISNLSPNTTYHYLVKSTDALGLVGGSVDQTFTTLSADTTPPVVSITLPTSGSAVSGVSTLNASATDNGAVAGVQFLVDGQAVGGEVGTAPYAYAWDSTTVSNGTHSIQARARDVAGNLATSSAVTVQVENIVASGLVGHWTFDEGSGALAADSSGAGDAGALLNGADWGTGAVGRSALALDGVDASASVPDTAKLRISGDLTLAVWVKHSSLPNANSWMYYAEKGQDDSENYAFGLYTDASNASRLFFEFVDASGTYRYYTQTNNLALSIGEWAHVSVIVNRTTGRLSFYRNGVQATSLAMSATLQPTTDPLIIGQQNIAGFTFPMSGLLDDLRIYNRALSSTEVSALASVGSVNVPPMAPTGLRVIATNP